VAEIVITPNGSDALDAGLMVDDAGRRFVVLTFREPGHDPVLVTFNVPMFEQYADYLARAAAFARDERNWRAPPAAD